MTLVFVSYGLAFLITALIYPGHFIFLHRMFMYSPDAGIPFVNTFALVNQLFHGGIQLYDRYDQLNYTYAQMSGGMFAVDNIITAFVYMLLSPFSSFPAEFFHHVFSIVYYVFTGLMRAIGGYLLLGLFLKDKLVIFISLVYLNTFLSTTSMGEGHISQGVYSFLPLLLYFILRFFQGARLNDFLAAALLMTVAVSNSPLFALGYFYVVVHFFILACLVYALTVKANRLQFLRAMGSFGRRDIFKVGIAAVLGILLLIPTLLMVPALQSDFYVANSGLGQTTGRISNAFKPLNYFNVTGKSFANPLEFLSKSVDFEHCNWGGVHWVFLGYGVLGFSLLALVLARDRRKYIFAGAITSIILLNVAPYRDNLFAMYWYLKPILAHPFIAFHQGLQVDQLPVFFLMSLSSLIHWINVMTNPFSFLLRSFHVPTLFMPYLFLPLIAMGVSVCVNLARGSFEGMHRGRIPWLIGFLGIYLAYCLWSMAGLPRVYAGFGISIFIMVLSLGLSQAGTGFGKRARIFSLLAILGLAEIYLLNIYVQSGPSYNEITPKTIEGLPTDQHPTVEYQNPRLLAFHEFMRTTPVEDLLGTPENYYGIFYQFTPMERDFVLPSIYTPIPLAYKDMYEDDATKEYLKRDSRLIDWRDYAVDASEVNMGELLSANWQDRVGLVNDQGAGHLSNINKIRLQPINPREEWRKFLFHIKDGHGHRVGNYWEYAFKLPANFPKYLSTEVFTADYNSWHLRWGQKMLTPVQGQLTDPYTFDVQNVRDGWLTMLVPAQTEMAGENIELDAKMPQGITDIWRNEQDRLGFTYDAPHTGWLFFHYPYDPKWQLTIDGMKSHLFRVNGYFMGTPLNGGKHRLLLSYWPDTPLRGWLVISMIVMVVIVEGLIIYAWKNQ